jgi:hypothetical protein
MWWGPGLSPLPRKLMKNPAFLIVCVMIAAAPLFRGSVHAWAQTLIQAMVALGGIVLVLEAMRSKGGRKRSSRSSSLKGFATREPLKWRIPHISNPGTQSCPDTPTMIFSSSRQMQASFSPPFPPWSSKTSGVRLTVFKWCVIQYPGPSQDGKREQI